MVTPSQRCKTNKAHEAPWAPLSVVEVRLLGPWTPCERMEHPQETPAATALLNQKELPPKELTPSVCASLCTGGVGAASHGHQCLPPTQRHPLPVEL